MKIEQLHEMASILGTDPFMKKCAMQVAETMMAHYFNHNIVTDGWEVGDDDFTDKEIDDASKINLEDPQFKKLVLQAVTKLLEDV